MEINGKENMSVNSNLKNFLFVIVCFHPNYLNLSKTLSLLGGVSTILVENSKLDSCKFPIDNISSVISPPRNIGYGAACNLGLNYGLYNQKKWIVIINQDLVFNLRFLERFSSEIIRGNYLMSGPFAGKLDKARYTTILNYDDLPEDYDYISGSCIAIHRDVIGKVGLFYEPYFMYYEDSDYCARARNKHIQLIKVSQKDVWHKDGESLGKGSYLHNYYLSRNHMLFVQRNAPRNIFLKELLRLPKEIILSIASRNRGNVDGIMDYLRHKFGQKFYQER